MMIQSGANFLIQKDRYPENPCYLRKPGGHGKSNITLIEAAAMLLFFSIGDL